MQFTVMPSSTRKSDTDNVIDKIAPLLSEEVISFAIGP
jgi:uncharacterized protein YqgV (UPF0045/DUF77 family)